MKTAIRKLGNSAGIIIPKAALAELGLAAGSFVDLRQQDGQLIVTPLAKTKRADWAEASRAIAVADDDALVWPEFTNSGDADLAW